MMTVANRTVGPDRFDLWFSDKPGQEPRSFDVETYRLCGHDKDAWLILDSYVKVESDAVIKRHPVRTVRAIFTPENGSPINLAKQGLAPGCGTAGQPYLKWDLPPGPYRIQVWGTLTENAALKWYWDAIIDPPAPVRDPCFSAGFRVRAVRVREAWWSNFKASMGRWGLGSGHARDDGTPDGADVTPGRTVWHAVGQLPYFMTGKADGKTVTWCAKRVTAASAAQLPTIR